MKFIRVAAVAVTLLVGVTASQAGLKFTLHDGTTTTLGSNRVTVTDNMTGAPDTVSVGLGQGATDYDSDLGIVSSKKFLPGTTPTSSHAGINYGTGGVYLGLDVYSFSAPGSASLTANSNLVLKNTTSSIRTVVLEISAEYTLPGVAGDKLNLNQSLSSLVFRNGSTSSSNANNSISMFTRAQPDLVDTATVTITGDSGASGGSSWALFHRSASSYMVTQYIVITLDTGESVQFDTLSELTEVPAPPALVLAALGIPALGLLRRFTRKTAVVA